MLNGNCTFNVMVYADNDAEVPMEWGDGVDDLVKRLAAAWHGPPGPQLRLLPERVELASLVSRVPADDTSGRLLLGINEKELAPVGLDPDTVEAATSGRQVASSINYCP